MDVKPSMVTPAVLRVSRRLTSGLVAAFVAECTVGSSGRWLVVGPLSIRMLLFLGCLLVAIPILWHERRYLARESFLWVVAAFLAALCVSAVWAHHLHNSNAFIAADLTTFSALLLVPTVLALRLTVSEVERLLSILFWGAVALALATLTLHVLAPLGVIDVNALSQWLTRHSLGGLADVGDGILRIYLRSEVLFIPALLLGVRRLATRNQPQPTHGRLHHLGYLVGSTVLTMGLVLSLTRSLWMGTLTALVVFFVWCARDLAALLRSLGLVLAGLAVLVGLSAVVYGGPALLRASAERLSPRLVVLLPSSDPTTPTGAPTPTSPTGTSTTTPTSSTTPTTSGPSTQPEPSPTAAPEPDPEQPDPNADAVQIRSRTLVLTKEKIRERPLTGWGIGYNLDEIRDDGRTEYLYWDLLMKLGAPGLALFLVLYAWTPVRLLTRRASLTGPASSAGVLSASLAGVAVTSYFNPFLNSTLGIVILVLLVAVAAAPPDTSAPPDTTAQPNRTRRQWRHRA